MKYCCQKLEEFIKNSECGDGWTSVIDEKKKKFYIVKNVRSCNDGDGRIDTWVDEDYQINYCPFCGEKL